MNEEALFFIMRFAERLYAYRDDDGSDMQKLSLAMYDAASEHTGAWAEFQTLRRPSETLSEMELRNPRRVMETAIEQDAATARMDGRMH